MGINLNNKFSPEIPAILDGSKLTYALVHEISIPLSHIKLSTEMLESMINDTELKIYLDVISRNSIRINNLLNQFLINKQDELQKDRFSKQAGMADRLFNHSYHHGPYVINCISTGSRS
jgi:signal transduction histidine kinase